MSSLAIAFRVGPFLLAASQLWSADSPLALAKTFGGSGNDGIAAMVAAPSGGVFVAGSTSSYDFPVTNGSRCPARFAAFSRPPSSSPLTPQLFSCHIRR